MTDSKKFTKLSQREHVLKRSDTYIGSIENYIEDLWVYDDIDKKIIKKNINYNPGLFKIFDEILVNAFDASRNDNTLEYIKIEYNKEENYISVENNGVGIPVEIHEEYKCYTPSMIFGELLTSTNFDDNIERITGGKNGIGCKACNIFSNRFIVEIIDSKRNKKFNQEWTDNMSKANKAKVTDIKNKKSYIKVTFYPDLEKFSLNTLNNDHYNLFYRRTIDIAAISGLKVSFNGELIKVNSFKSYMDLHFPNETIYVDDSNERWTVGVIYKPDVNEVISFVNGINTYRGGTHCNNVIDNIIKILINDNIKKKDKEIKISPQLVKENLIFFINSTIVNPSFSSQSKDTLTSKVDKFGSKYTPNPAFLKKLAKCGIVEQIIELAKFKENNSLKKTDGKKAIKIRGIPKLDDANKAGTKESMKCSLILTEGDSAKTFATSGLSIIGSDYFGIFPLKGKLLNVREATPAQVLNNDEINNLKQIIGLKHGEDYSDDSKFNQLRYGRIVILCDSDVDGSHIKGLLMNFIHSIWPSLIKRTNFITTLATPIVKASKGDKIKCFYNLTEYEDWVKNSETKNWKIKYYKGLGTSTASEARESFIDFEEKLIKYTWPDINSDEKDDDKVDEVIELPYNIKDNDDALTLAFRKDRANDRKVWIQNYDRNKTLYFEDKAVPISSFIHYDLIHFSVDDNSRSIPSLIDGLKPSQRKILYGAFLRGLDKDEVKVAQLAGFVSDKAAYHHGEMSLNGAIIGMAQNYVGSNNINILKPIGQFGSRLLAGKDSASPRYIWTKFEDLTTIIFNPNDNPILINQMEDNDPIEPLYYGPIIPMILVNGTEGIGTGFSTSIPAYNPLDIINNLKNRLKKGEEFEDMMPWYNGFEGSIFKHDDKNYEIFGCYSQKNNKIIITELPIGESTQNYKDFLEKMLEGDIDPKSKNKEKRVKKVDEFIGYTCNNTDTKVYFELEFSNVNNVNNIEKTFHLSKKLSITNMHLFNPDYKITKYDSVVDIMNEYYDVRIDLYEKRKLYELEILEYQLNIISNKVRFILMIIEKKLVVNNKKKVDIEAELEKFNFPQFGKNKNDNDLSYNYLLSMPIYNLTFEKIEELRKQKQDKEDQYTELNSQSSETIWYSELNKLEKEYKKWLNLKKLEENKNIKSLKKNNK